MNILSSILFLTCYKQSLFNVPGYNYLRLTVRFTPSSHDPTKLLVESSKSGRSQYLETTQDMMQEIRMEIPENDVIKFYNAPSNSPVSFLFSVCCPTRVIYDTNQCISVSNEGNRNKKVMFNSPGVSGLVKLSFCKVNGRRY